MQSVRNCSKPREIVGGSFPDDGLLGDGSGQPVFEGFSDSQADRNRPRANHRVSVLQAAKRGLLARSLGSPDIAVPFSSGGSALSSLSPAMSLRILGFCRRVGVGGMDRQHSFRPSVVVERAQHSRRGATRYSSYEPSLLVRHVRSRLGCPCRRPVCFWPVVTGGDLSINQSPGVEGHSPGPSTLLVSARGVVGQGVRRQHHSSGVYSQAGRNSLASPEQGGSAPAPMGGASTDSFVASVCDGHSRRGGRFSLATQRGDRFQVDPGTGGGGSPGSSLASKHRCPCHGSESSDASLLCSDGGPSVVGHRRSSPILESSTGIRFSSFSASSSGHQQVLGVDKLRDHSSGSVVASTGMVPRSPTTGAVPSGGLTSSSGPSLTAPLSSFPPQSAVAASSLVETVRRFAREWGMSSAVARQLVNCHWPSSQRLYQHRWLAYRRWCRSKGHTVSSPSVAKISDFLLFLRRDKGLSVSAVKGFRSMLTSVFKYRLPELSDYFLLRDLIRSFELERPVRSPCPPTWDLYRVLECLRGPVFEPLASKDLRMVPCKVLFLFSLATAKRVSELQALSRSVAFSGKDLSLSYLPEFVAKTESERNPLPHSFLVRSLEDFVGDLPEDRLLCPVRALCVYLRCTEALCPLPRALFVSPSCPSRALSKNALSYFIRRVIIDSGAVGDGVSPGSLSVKRVATSVLFMRNWSVSRVLEGATWKSNPVFASFYLRDVSLAFDGFRALGPVVTAVSVIN